MFFESQVEFLLDYGAVLEAKSDEKQTPAHFAARNDAVAALKVCSSFSFFFLFQKRPRFSIRGSVRLMLSPPIPRYFSLVLRKALA